MFDAEEQLRDIGRLARSGDSPLQLKEEYSRRSSVWPERRLHWSQLTLRDQFGTADSSRTADLCETPGGLHDAAPQVGVG